MIRLLFIVIGYLFGMFQTGHFYGKLVNVDLHKCRSGNPGATIALRVMGLKGGLIVFFFDCMKAFIPCFTVRMIFRGQPMEYVYYVWTAFGVIIGNNYPFYLKFKGGKGVAATGGLTMALNGPMTIIGIIIFFSLAFITRYVSVASIIIAISLSAMAVLFSMPSIGWMPIKTPQRIEFLVVWIFLMALMIWRHKSNIKRLLNGTENRFGSKKKG